MGSHEEKHRRNRKQLPYGSKKKREWCGSCDRHQVEIVSKGAERQRAKTEIRNAPVVITGEGWKP